ncbi:MAG: RluA family pseudouridine synthase, partial [Firmicutes bacterium]|nr:RluA family pseudouridine synthase [Bacillota bacterium]
MMKTLTADTPARLDVLVAEGCGVTRSQAAKWIADGLCLINGKQARKAGTAIKAGDAIAVSIPAPASDKAEKENIPIHILYQDQDIAVVDKPCGMVTHPAGGNNTGTLVNALLYALDGLSGIGGVQRPGIVHRLDKDTSGILLIAKNDKAHVALSKQLKDRSVEKHYLAVVEGVLKEPEGLIDQPVGRSKRDRKQMAVTGDGRPSQTEWAVVETLKQATLLDVRILTGRTHQIRVHMRHIHHPVAGDPVYGLKGGVKAPRLMLHA